MAHFMFDRFHEIAIVFQGVGLHLEVEINPIPVTPNLGMTASARRPMKAHARIACREVRRVNPSKSSGGVEVVPRIDCLLDMSMLGGRKGFLDAIRDCAI